MTITYQPGSASLSWLASAQAIDGRALMEQALFDEANSAMTASLNMAKAQADNIKLDLKAQANQILTDGIAQIGGAVAGTATLAVACGKANSYYKQANDPAIEDRVGVRQGQQAQPQVEVDDEFQDAVENQDEAPVRAEIIGQNGPQAQNLPAQDPREQNRIEAARRGEQWTQSANSLSQSASGVVSGSVNFFKVKFLNDQAAAKEAETIASGVAAVMNTQTGLITNALSSCDNSMNGANSIIGSIIQASRA